MKSGALALFAVICLLCLSTSLSYTPMMSQRIRFNRFYRVPQIVDRDEDKPRVRKVLYFGKKQPFLRFG
ncbi:hypothetical protein L596_021046 [Steinernema carpocapsae]|uniref:Uncharacterized protein n=1 Tax=Steinernema carpocapsae TaxID=34508 RepID=A0A4U5MVJ5_STECR|nr:hypothetical protein L596_021046 [Steinernema carpocapsae]